MLVTKCDYACNVMLQGRPSLREFIADKISVLTPRVKALLWASLLSLLIGISQFGEPFDDVLRGSRDYIRQQEYTGNAVVVGIDDKTAAAFGGFQYSKKIDAAVIDRLFALGAKRVFVDKSYSVIDGIEANAAFEDTLKRHKGRIFLTTRLSLDSSTGKAKEILYNRQYMDSATLVSTNAYITPFQLSLQLPTEIKVEGRNMASLSAVIAESRVQGQSKYRPDFSILVSSIPIVSLYDIYTERSALTDFTGKDIVIGETSNIFSDKLMIPTQGFRNKIYSHILGAQLLKKGGGENWSWWPVWLIALACAAGILFLKKSQFVIATFTVSLLSFLIIPIFLDVRLISVDVFPAVLLCVIATFRSFLIRKTERDNEINIVSGLPNLSALRRVMPKTKATLIALKIRNYSAIVAGFGADVENAVITEVMRRIAIGRQSDGIYHEADTLVWFTDTQDKALLSAHLEGLNRITSATMHIEGQAFDLLLSFGIDADNERPMGTRIGSAMLCAQEAADDNQIWKFYDPERRHTAAWEISLLDSINQAIDNGEIWVAYQAKLDLKTGQATGAEALVRWSHPTRGLVGPDQFIEIAERNNRIDRLTAFVLDQAIETAALINKDFGAFNMAVNLSVQLLHHPDLLPMIGQALVRHGLPPSRLTLEITETSKLAQNAETIAILRRIVGEGITLSLDDYGTGNATLDYLKLLPFGEIKIDRSFINNVADVDHDRILVESTINMAHSLGCKVVAEGVETAETQAILSKLGCDIVQGYHIGYPIRQIAFIQSLSDQGLKRIA
jgi:diguanylate cyclase